MAHVFISYARDNEQEIQRLYKELTGAGVEVWLDKTQIKPGQNWKVAIAEAIDKGDFFLACFSKEYSEKRKRYMNEEITLAVEQLRQRGDDTTWFIPVLLSGEVPQKRIDASRKLTDIQWVELNEANWDQGIQQIFQTIQPPRRLRSEAINNLTQEAVKSILREQGFFDNRRHWDGPGMLHQYGAIKRQGQKLVIDHTTGLTWQQSGSPPKSATTFKEPPKSATTFKEAQKYIKELRGKKYAGFSDWRLPTLVEAMSLMEPKKNEAGLYIDPIFDKNLRWIWTADRIWNADRICAPGAWAVSFSFGYCGLIHVGYDYFVRAVR